MQLGLTRRLATRHTAPAVLPCRLPHKAPDSRLRPGFARPSAARPASRASANARGVQPPPALPVDTGRPVVKGFWTFVDVLAIIGSVGGALATLLGLVPAAYATYALSLPLVLPIISLVAALQRESVIAEVG